jgi:hypothetical protein
MTPINKPSESAEPFLVAANEGQTPSAGFSSDIQELFFLGMDCALEIQKTSLAAAVCLHSCAIDIYKSATCFAPETSAFLDMAAKSFALGIELHSNWLTLLAPWSTAICAGNAPTAEELAHHMDIACGHQHTVEESTVASSSGSEAKQDAEENESDMDIATGEWVA